MDIRIVFDDHAFRRIQQRAEKHNIDVYDAQLIIEETIRLRNNACKHYSRKYNTYCKYFDIGFTLYVICEEKKKHDFTLIIVKTIIIERGRQK